MQDQKVILAAYLDETIAEYGLELDAATLELVHEHVKLEPHRPPDSEERRAITQKLSSSGKHSASSFKLTNIARINTEELLGLAWKYAGITLFDDTVKKIIYSTIGLLIDFYPKLKVAFTEQEAKVIYAISHLPEKAPFDQAAVAECYQRTFGQSLPDDGLSASLDILAENGVLQRVGEDQYRRRERIKNLKRV